MKPKLDQLGLGHKPVLLTEVITNLQIKPAGVYVDATFGRGGHSREILLHLDSQGTLICIDKDSAAIKAATELNDQRLVIRQGSYTKLKSWIDELNLIGKVDGILLDLGVSSPQLDEPARGFSFMQDGPLDMRMNQEQRLTAALWINQARESEIREVLYEYGEEKFGRRIARAIVNAREIEPINTTGRLAEIVSRANPKWEQHKHPATRVFQAIRIFINNELTELQDCLDQSLEVLAVGGRLLVISFHSLEDRIVKRFMQQHASSRGIPKGVPLRQDQIKIDFRILGRPIKASASEIKSNPRARSAVLRMMEKLR